MLTAIAQGRRNLLLFTFPNMAWSLLAAGLCFLIQVDNGARVALIAFFVFLFAAFYSPGEGPVPFTYSAGEPSFRRRSGSLSLILSFLRRGIPSLSSRGWHVMGRRHLLFWSSVLGLTFPRLLGSFGPTGAFGFYAGLNMV